MNFTKISFNDLEFLNNVRNTYANDYLHDSRTFSLEETQEWFLKFNPDYRIIWNNDEKIGYFRLTNFSLTNKNIYIGADIHPNFTGKGFGHSAYLEFLPVLFKEYNLHKISLEVLETNKRALNLYNKIGFVYEGMKRNEVLKKGVYVGSIIMSILHNEINKK